MLFFSEKIFSKSIALILIKSINYFLTNANLKTTAKENSNSSLNNIENEMQNHNFNSSWEKVDFEKSYERNIKWEKMKQNEFPIINKRAKDNSNLFLIENYQIRVLNRSIVFQGNDTVGQILTG